MYRCRYGEPPAQLSAARVCYHFKNTSSRQLTMSKSKLWAVMLRNSSESFIFQSTARKFLDTLEELINSSRTSPVVRERVLYVVAAAAYVSGSRMSYHHFSCVCLQTILQKRTADSVDCGGGSSRRISLMRCCRFRADCQRVLIGFKGMPLDNDDAMFHPPISSHGSHHEIPLVLYHEASPLPGNVTPHTPSPPVSISIIYLYAAFHCPSFFQNPQRKRKSSTRNRIISPEEDIRRLFQECAIGQGNASLLSQALALSTPEDLKQKEVIKVCYPTDQWVLLCDTQ
jgi:hypothetical protein